MENIKTQEELNVLEGNVIIDFWANWCGPCRAFSPTFEKVSENNPDITFVKCNTDEAQELASYYKISSIPCLKYLKDGKEVGTTMGMMTEEGFQKKIDEFFKED